MSENNSAKFCCRCKEDFPVSTDIKIRMGFLHPLKRMPTWIKKQFHDWIDSEIHGEGYAPL